MNTQENDQKLHQNIHTNQENDFTHQNQLIEDEENDQNHIQFQENDQTHIQDQENDQKQEENQVKEPQKPLANQKHELQEQKKQEKEPQNSLENQVKELQKSRNQEQEVENFSRKSNPTMSSSPPKSPPLQDSVQHFESNTYNYVFSPQESLNQSTTYHSSPTSHAYAYSPDIKPAKPPSPPPPVNVSKVGSKPEDLERGGGGESGGGGGISKKNPYSSFGIKNEILKKRALLGSRVISFFCCLVSFSIMAADKSQGWAIDSFDQYKEFRYCMAVNIIGFVYSGFQAYSLAYSLATGRFSDSNLRCLLDFSVDQILTYLLLSASSSAIFRVEDWESNWGKDQFPSMAKSSVVLSFLAFVAFALCSLLSGEIHFTSKS